MTTMAKLEKRGLVEKFDVYRAYVDAKGKVVGLDFTAPSGWQGNRTERECWLHEWVTVRCVRHHAGKWFVCSEDMPLVQAAVDAA